VVLIRRLSVEEKIQRIRDRFEREIAAHNAHVLESALDGRAPSVHDQVLGEFDPTTRRLVR
jgi:hypothetical protein